MTSQRDDVEPDGSVTVYPDGPLVVRGDVEIRALDGTVLASPGQTVALCRCGRSAVKPFCDGNHRLARARAAAGPSTTPLG
jgi:CDGSH-type Zn-finger protein